MWLNPASPLRQEAVTALQVSTGFTSRMIENALAAAFEELTDEKLLNFCASEIKLGENVLVPQKVLHILAGNVFTAWLPGAVITLLLGAECDLKPSSQEPVFALLWKRSFQQADPALGEKIQIVRWQDDLLQRYEAVVAYGTDETLAALKPKLNPGTRFVGYGHKFSVGIIWKEALTPENLPDALAQVQSAVEPFDLQGCLSPQIIYLEGGDPRVLEPLTSQVRVMPKIKRFDSWLDLQHELESFQKHLSSLGMAGPMGRFAEIYSDVENLGISRVCAFGEMQQPPMTWRNGGISLVEALTV